MTIGPVVLLGLLSIFFMLTTVRSSMMEEIEEGLKGTAAATLAAYDQNTGDYMESSNGDIWKGSYNISRSESLVDRIRDNTGMDVTFFYGDRRIMTSAVDSNGDRILNSPAGDRIVEKVLQNGEEYFSSAVSLDGVMNYGYFMPVYQNDSTEIIGMVFVGANKEDKDAVVNGMIFGIGAAVCVAMILCMGVGLKLATSISRNIKKSIGIMGKVAEGDLTVWVDDKMLKRKDERRSVTGYCKIKGYSEGYLERNLPEFRESAGGFQGVGNCGGYHQRYHERGTECCKSGRREFYRAVPEFREYFREHADHGRSYHRDFHRGGYVERPCGFHAEVQ